MAALLATIAAAVASALGGHSAPSDEKAGAFGGPVHRIGHIEVDLEQTSSVGLRQVPCAVGPESCFVAR